MIVVATLTIRPGALEGFRVYEAKAAEILESYGGAIAKAVFVPSSHSGEAEREVHVVTFPDARAFAAYRADPRLGALAEMRSAAIAKTEILVGEPGPDYHAKG